MAPMTPCRRTNLRTRVLRVRRTLADVEIMVLHVADCPNVAVVLERIAVACGDSSVQVSTRLVDTDADAATLGMRGSPTVLVDGRDVGGDSEVGVACRLHLPTVDALRSAVDARR